MNARSVGGKDDPNLTVTPILTADPLKRLDALIRRHGGKPKADVDPSKIVLPMPKRGPVENQMSIDDVEE